MCNQKAWSEKEISCPGRPQNKSNPFCYPRMTILKFPAVRERRSKSYKKYENTSSVRDKFKVSHVKNVSRKSAAKKEKQEAKNFLKILINVNCKRERLTRKDKADTHFWLFFALLENAKKRRNIKAHWKNCLRWTPLSLH